MTLINHKLRSSRGATMIYALAALLVITIVSFLVISSATVNVGRVQKTQDEQQSYLNVSSAADLVKKSIDGEEIEVKVTSTTVDGVTITEAPQIVTKKTDETNSLNGFSEVLADWVAKVSDEEHPILYSEGSEPMAEYLLTENVSYTKADGTNETKTAYVRVHLKMDIPAGSTAGYGLTATMTEVQQMPGKTIDLRDEETFSEKTDYGMVVGFSARVEKHTSSMTEYEPITNAAGVEIGEKEIIHTIKTTSVKWTAGDIAKKGA